MCPKSHSKAIFCSNKLNIQAKSYFMSINWWTRQARPLINHPKISSDLNIELTGPKCCFGLLFWAYFLGVLRPAGLFMRTDLQFHTRLNFCSDWLFIFSAKIFCCSSAPSELSGHFMLYNKRFYAVARQSLFLFRRCFASQQGLRCTTGSFSS